MARKKTITREQILAAAYEVAATDGFTRFTARNIANKMNCSTQPIYLEFKNMDDLRQAESQSSRIGYREKSKIFRRKKRYSRVIICDGCFCNAFSL
ncbi:hypothetical protein EfmAA610_09480 [Enterococcus faecium]|nr:hypothetical protein EfmAA610_09480 [Enterococcus faecium]